MAADFYIKAGDRWPTLDATLTDADGTAIDLSGATVKFVMGTVGGTAKINADATVVSAAAGTVRYSWAAGDTTTPGTYHGEFVVTLATALEITFPSDGYITIEIVREVPKPAVA